MTAPGPLLLLKLLLAPSLVALASVASAKLGPRVGGLLGAFPMVSGPILLLFALEQGPGFTSEAAFETLFGTLSLVLYCAAYAKMASALKHRASAWLALLCGYATFFAFTLLLERVPWPRHCAVPFALGAVLLGLGLVRPPQSLAGNGDTQSRISRRTLLLRMLAAAALVLSLSEAAAFLGPSYSGLLTPFPVSSTVLLVATHLEQGAAAMRAWLRGFLVGLFGYITFIALVAYLLLPCGITLGFAIALVGAFAVQALVAKTGRER